jgi:hypothetical protein
MTYLRSPQHIENAKNALKKTQRKVLCAFCNAPYSIGNIARHENHCYVNPVNKKNCIVCDNPIKNYKTSKTCGYSCANTHFRSGPKNGNWSDNSYRTTCFHHHDKKCVVCGEENIVEVHHLDENSSNNKPENLIPLCPTHHQYWHSRHKHLIEDIVMEYINNWLVKVPGAAPSFSPSKGESVLTPRPPS